MVTPRNPARIVAVPALSVDLIRPPAWHQHAACADPELRMAFWEAENELEQRRPADKDVLKVAQRICGTCPARPRCDEEWQADEGDKPSQHRTGIRAGLTPAQREKKAKELA